MALPAPDILADVPSDVNRTRTNTFAMSLVQTFLALGAASVVGPTRTNLYACWTGCRTSEGHSALIARSWVHYDQNRSRSLLRCQ